MRVPRAPWETTEQEKAAERIARRVGNFEEDVKLRVRSIYSWSSLTEKLEESTKPTWISSIALQYRFYLQFLADPGKLNDFIIYLVRQTTNGEDSYKIEVKDAGDLQTFFGKEGENWIRLAVFIEDSIEQMIKNFKGLYLEHLKSLDFDARSLSLRLYESLVEVDKLKMENNDYKYLLQKTIEFLQSTKGICKSKEIKMFREVLEETLREIQGLSSLPPLREGKTREGPPEGPENLITKGR